jgi:hypothetical protein
MASQPPFSTIGTKQYKVDVGRLVPGHQILELLWPSFRCAAKIRGNDLSYFCAADAAVSAASRAIQKLGPHNFRLADDTTNRPYKEGRLQK